MAQVSWARFLALVDPGQYKRFSWTYKVSRYELCDCRQYLPLFGYSGSLLSKKNIEIAIKREKRRQMNKSIFLLLYLVCTWSLIICTCCSDRGTAERNLIFSHFLCLQLFGLTGYTKTRVDKEQKWFKSTWTTGIWNFGIERILSGNHVMDCFSFVVLSVKRNQKVGVRELQGGWLVGLGREFTWKLGKDTIKT